MKKTFKNATAIALAAVLAASMSTVAFAADPIPGAEITGGAIGDGTDGVGGSVAIPKIQMVAPTFANESLVFDVYNQMSMGQIVSSNWEFINYSTVPVKLALTEFTIAGTDGSDTALTTLPTFVADPTKETVVSGTDSNIFMWLNAGTKGGTTEAPAYTYPSFKTEVDAENGGYVIDTTGETSGKVTLGTAVEFGVLAAGSEVKQAADGTMDAPTLIADATGNATYLRLEGAMNPDADWSNVKTISFTPVFSVTPQVNEGTGGGSSATTVTASGTLTSATVKLGTGFVNLTSTTPFKAGNLVKGTDFTIDCSGKAAAATPAATIVPSGTAETRTTAKATVGKYTLAAKDDVVTITLKPSAFDPAANVTEDVVVIVTLVS